MFKQSLFSSNWLTRRVFWADISDTNNTEDDSTTVDATDSTAYHDSTSKAKLDNSLPVEK